MEKSSSLMRELRAKNNSNSNQNKSAFSLPVILGVAGSTAFLLMMIMDRPHLLIWMSGIAAAFLIGKRMLNQSKKAAPKPIHFPSLHQHQVSRYGTWMKGLHFSHDELIDQLTRGIDRDLKLASSKKFLGAHLLAGPKGTGKSQLAHLIGQVLFGKSNVIEFDFKQLDQEAFANLFLDMLESVSSNPHQLILLENIDSMPAYMAEPFLGILKSNQWVGEEDQSPILFSGCMFLLTVTAPDEVERSWLDQSETVDYRLVSFCSEVIFWGTLPYQDVATIVTLQIVQYWKSHSIQLDYISANAIFHLLKESKGRSHLGMHPYPQVIRQKSARALEQALTRGYGRTKIDIDEQGYFKIRGAA